MIIMKKMKKELTYDNYIEIGTTGLSRFGGIINDEWLSALNSLSKSNKIYREMRDNDATIGAIFFIIDMLCRQVPWNVKPGGISTQAIEKADFLDSCINDLEISWHDTISSIMSMLVYGWALNEKVFKIRQGINEDDKLNSKYNDGKIGWRKFPLRSQTSLYEWQYNKDTRKLEAMIQLDPVTNQKFIIPIKKALHFRTDVSKDNPQGRSLLRNIYKAYYYKKNLEEIEAIGVEHNALGVLVGWVPTAILTDSKNEAIKNEYQTTIENIKKNESSGLLFPLEYDKAGNKRYDLQMLSMNNSSNSADIGKIIERYDTRIAQSLCAEFIMLGTQQTGSYALASNKTMLFSVAIGVILDIIADKFNTDAIPELFRLNGDNMEELPILEHGDIESVDLKELSEFVYNLSRSGAPLWSNPELIKKLMRVANLPEPENDVIIDTNTLPDDGNNE